MAPGCPPEAGRPGRSCGPPRGAAEVPADAGRWASGSVARGRVWGEGLRHGEGPGQLGSRTQTEACPRRLGFGTLESDVGSVWLE